MLQTYSHLSAMSSISMDSKPSFPGRLIDRGHSAKSKRFRQLILNLCILIPGNVFGGIRVIHTSTEKPSNVSVARDSTLWNFLNGCVDSVEPPLSFVRPRHV